VGSDQQSFTGGVPPKKSPSGFDIGFHLGRRDLRLRADGCVANAEKSEHEVLYADSIGTDGLRFNDGVIPWPLGLVGKRQPWTYLCRPKRGGAVAGKDLVLRNASCSSAATRGR
jgi:hypothetical protein